MMIYIQKLIKFVYFNHNFLKEHGFIKKQYLFLKRGVGNNDNVKWQHIPILLNSALRQSVWAEMALC
jgi:hypothetical protein